MHARQSAARGEQAEVAAAVEAAAAAVAAGGCIRVAAAGKQGARLPYGGKALKLEV